MALSIIMIGFDPPEELSHEILRRQAGSSEQQRSTADEIGYKNIDSWMRNEVTFVLSVDEQRGLQCYLLLVATYCSSLDMVSNPMMKSVVGLTASPPY
jgi:hypothetical protein